MENNGTIKRLINPRTFRGVVVSDSMDKTRVIKVERTKMHAKYGKSFTVTRNFKVHDVENKYHVGDVVEFVECRPISKEKRWKVVRKV